MSLIEEEEIVFTKKESDPIAQLDELEIFEERTDKVVEVTIIQNLKDVNDISSSEESDYEKMSNECGIKHVINIEDDDYDGSDSGDDDNNIEKIEVPISELIAKLKREVDEELISKTETLPSECCVNFGKFIGDETNFEESNKEDKFEVCKEADIEDGKTSIVLEAKIIQNRDSDMKMDKGILKEVKLDTSAPEIISENKKENVKYDTPSSDIKVDKVDHIDLVSNLEYQSTKLESSRRKNKHISSDRKTSKSKHSYHEVLNNYDIIDRTEAKRLSPAPEVFSFATFFGKLRRTFGTIEEHKDAVDEKQSFIQSTVVNLSIEQTDTGEEMQVITIAPVAKVGSDKMVVYVDELDGNYLDEQGSDMDSDGSSVFDGDTDVLDVVDTLPTKNKFSYGLPEEKKADDANTQVLAIGIKSNLQRAKISQTFGGSDTDLTKVASKYRRKTLGFSAAKSDGIGSVGLMPFHSNTFKKKTSTSEPFVLLTDGYPAIIPDFPSDRRSLIALEVYTTERTFVRGLEITVHLFKKRISMNNLLDAKELKILFSNIEDILLVNRDILDDLFDRICDWSDEQCIGDIFLNHENHFKIYSEYCKTYDSGEALLKQKLKKKKDFEIFLTNCYSNPICVPGLTLPSYLITVIQRIPRYILLFKDLIKRTPETHPDSQNLIQALAMMEKVAKFINEQLKQEQCAKALEALQTQITGLKAYYTPERTLVHEGDVCLLTSKKTYHCVLFNDLLVFAVKSGVRQTAVELALEIKTVWIEDLEELDPQTTKKDAIGIYTPERPYTMYVGNVGEKKIWLQNLREAIQRNLYKENTKDALDIETRNTSYIYKDESVYSGYYYKAKRHGQGTGMWPNQYTYIGEWEDDEWNGYGVLNFACGDNYEGQWVDNKEDGKGTYTKKNGDMLIGHWKEGRKSGSVTIEYHNGDRFHGNCENDKIEGEGELICINGFKYKGDWKDNLKHGNGTLTTSDCLEYTGQFSFNKFHGKGELHFPDGSIYNGEFDRGERSGSGTYTQPGGWIYEGQWMHDLKDGRGKMVYENGDVYEGTWMHDMRIGQGVLVYNCGGYYRGQWNGDLMHGSGILETKDGSVYDGEFFENKMTGSGKMRYKNGIMYNGQWKDNCPNGKGILTKPGQWSCDGNWSQGKQNGFCFLRDPANGYSYQGDWINGVKEGSGKELLNESTFEGTFADDLRQGSGIETLADGTTFEGCWSRGQKHGRFVQRKQHGVVEHQVWSRGCLMKTPTELPASEIPLLQRWL